MINKTVRNVVIGVLILVMALMLVGIGVILRDILAPSSGVAESDTAVPPVVAAVTGTETATAVPPTATAITVLASASPLPVPATLTPLPTVTPSLTPPATETPLPTATNTPLPPTAVPPTAVPVTNTPIPPTVTPTPSGPLPTNANGLQGGGFGLQDWRTSLTPGGQIWYEWTVVNTTGSGVPYSTIGVMPREGGEDIVAWYQNNWGGNNDVMPPEGLSWPSWLSIPEAGDYTLRVVVCFDGYETCIRGGGTFYTLSQEIPVSIR